MRVSKIVLIAGLFIAVLTPLAQAQDWPTRPITMVVPFAAGSGSDAIARIFAKRLSETLGGQVIVENIGGAGGMTAASRVAQAPPDGYQFIFGTSSTHAVNQSLYKKPLYDAAADFAPVSLVVEQQTVLVTRKGMPANDLPAFVSHVRANHETMQFGSGGLWVSNPPRLRAR